ncbi:MAG TPA: hypothetical protein VMR25_17740 [Planctomycetaceae bacterium]|nr:hypothetical protein [Planctomycetaceae bacterium]
MCHSKIPLGRRRPDMTILAIDLGKPEVWTYIYDADRSAAAF